MSPLELANQYMAIIYGQQDLALLGQLLADDCHFKGPFYEFNSAEAYIASLKAAPPDDFEYEIIAAYENDSSACLVYQFKRQTISTPMAQVFEVSNNQITGILLIFDSSAF